MLLFGRSRRTPGKVLSPRKRKIRRTIKWLFLLGVAAFVADAAWYEPYHPVLATYDVSIPGLPKSMDGFRVVQLSDFHRSASGSDRLIANGVAVANASHADLAVLTGDFVSVSASNAEPCCKILSRLHTTFGSIAVLGNHDYWTDDQTVSSAVRSSGIRLLVNDSIRLDNGLRVVGLDDEWSGSPSEMQALGDTGSAESTLVLCHEPTSFYRFASQPVLVLCGHTHGGVINLPGVVGVSTAMAHCDGYIGGWYKRGRALMYVSRGLASAFPSIRFRNRAEVTLFILHPTSNPRPRVLHRPRDQVDGNGDDAAPQHPRL